MIVDTSVLIAILTDERRMEIVPFDALRLALFESIQALRAH